MTQTALADLSFFAVLLPKMVLVALLVVVASVATERLGPVIGALIATLPVTSGPVFVFLALDHDASYLSGVALSTLAATVPTAIFLACYVLAAQRLPTRISLPGGLFVWVVYAILSMWADKSLPTALVMSLMVFPLCVALAQPYTKAAVPHVHSTVWDITMRGVAVALFVAVVETLSLVGGPELTGLLMAFPIVFICMIVIIQPRQGGAAAGAVMAQAIPGLVGISLAMLTVHLLTAPLGKWWALSLGLCVSVGWNLMLFALHRRTASKAKAAA